MKRWNTAQMLKIGQQLFAKMHKRKFHAHHNADIHFFAREIDDLLPAGVKALQNGTYSPRNLKRYHFPDEMVYQLHPTDRVLQHILLKILKPTFKHVMNPSCFHLHGPTGVKYATEHIKKALIEKQPTYLIRADIKSYYKSIIQFKLIQDIKENYDDTKLITMLENIITNPIDTPRGTRNPINGVALRGPLSQFFSALYLKKLDDAFLNSDVTYVRYQDYLLILCQTKRQFLRARRKLMEVLQERHLTLSRKKSRMGLMTNFHFLGISYFPTQLEDNTIERQVESHTRSPALTYWGAQTQPNLPANNEQYLDDMGGGSQLLSIYCRRSALRHMRAHCGRQGFKYS